MVKCQFCGKELKVVERGFMGIPIYENHVCSGLKKAQIINTKNEGRW